MAQAVRPTDRDAGVGPPSATPEAGAQSTATAGLEPEPVQPVLADLPVFPLEDGFPETGPVEIGFWKAVGWVVALLLVEVVTVVVGGCFLGIALAGSESAPDRTTLLMAMLVVADVVMALFAWKQIGAGARRALAVRRPRPLHLLLAVLCIPPLLVLDEEIIRRSSQALDAVVAAPAAYVHVFEELFEQIARLPWPWMFLIGCILPGVTEEVFYRGFLGRGLVANFGPTRGILITSLLFGAMHIDPVQASTCVLTGAVLHLVYLTSKSLVAPIFLHTLHNAVAFTQVKLALEGTFDVRGGDGFLDLSPALLGAALAALVGLAVVLYETRVRWLRPDGEVWSPGYASAEMPPATEQAIPARHRAGSRGVVFAVAGYFAFAVFFGLAAHGWLAGDSARALLQQAQQDLGRQEYDRVIAACTEALQRDHRLASAHGLRGDARRLKGNVDQAIEDYNEAIRLDPNLDWVHAARGEAHRLKADLVRALADCERAIGQNPRLGWAYAVRGLVYRDQDDRERAVADWMRAIKLEPDLGWVHREVAWLWATSPDARHRNGTNAVEHARKACELSNWEDGDCLIALAAAHAEFGDFRMALRYQEEALTRAAADQRPFYTLLLEHYRGGRPFREGR